MMGACERVKAARRGAGGSGRRASHGLLLYLCEALATLGREGGGREGRERGRGCVSAGQARDVRLDMRAHMTRGKEKAEGRNTEGKGEGSVSGETASVRAYIPWRRRVGE